MKGVYVGDFTGVSTIKIISKHWSPIFNNWLYRVKSTSRTNQYYKLGSEFYCYPSEVCLKVSYKNRGNTIIRQGSIDFDSIPEGEQLEYRLNYEI